MNPRYRVELRRHRILYSLPMVLITLLAIWYVAGTPKAYQSGASLWVDTPAPEASSLTQTSEFVVTPAAQAQELLNELLTTREFRLDVGRGGPLTGYLAGHPSSGFGPSGLLAKLRGKQSTDSLVVGALDAKHVLTTVAGPQVLAMSVKEPTATVALGTMRALIRAFNKQRTSFNLERAQTTLAYYQNQAKAADETLASTQSDMQTFLAANPTATNVGQTAQDAQLRSLLQAQKVARSRYSAANRAANQSALNLKATISGRSSFAVFDAPQLGVAVPAGQVFAVEKVLDRVGGGEQRGLIRTRQVGEE